VDHVGDEEDPTRIETYFSLVEENKANKQFKCLICFEKVWNVSNCRVHAEKRHPNDMGEIDWKVRVSAKAKKEAEEKRGGMTRFMVPKSLAVTKEDADMAVVKYIAVTKSSLNMVEAPGFKQMIDQIARHQQGASERYTAPGRNKVVSVLEKKGGVLECAVDELLARIGAGTVNLRQKGAALVMDGQTTFQGQSHERMLARVGQYMVPLASVWSRGSKTTTVLVDMVVGVLEERYDPSELLISEERFKPRSEQYAEVQLLRVAAATSKYIMFSVGDCAPVARAQRKELEVRLGVVHINCAAHAFSKGLQYGVHAVMGEAFMKEKARLQKTFARGKPKSLLVGQSGGRAMTQDCETRFVQQFISSSNNLKLRDALRDTINLTEWKRYKAELDEEKSADIAAAEATVLSDKFWAMLVVLNTLCLSYVYPCRAMDSALPGSICFVFAYFARLNESNKVALAKYNNENPGVITKETLAAVNTANMRAWDYFHCPAYAAAYFLCWLFRAEVLALGLEDKAMRLMLIEETLDVLILMFRHSDETMVPRAEVLPVDSCELRPRREVYHRVLQDYLDGTGAFKAINFDECKEQAPWRLWEVDTPISNYCVSLLLQIAASSDAERLHHLVGSTHCPARPRLGFTRTYALVAVAINEREKKRELTSLTETWQVQLKMFKKYDLVDDASEAFVNALDESLAQMDKEEEEMADAAAEAGAMPPPRRTHRGLGASEDADARRLPPLPVQRSRFGRRIKKKRDASYAFEETDPADDEYDEEYTP
jgi:hypothetical protein